MSHRMSSTRSSTSRLQGVIQQIQDRDLKDMLEQMSQSVFEDLKATFNTSDEAAQVSFEEHILALDNGIRRTFMGKGVHPRAGEQYKTEFKNGLQYRYRVSGVHAALLVGLMLSAEGLLYDLYVHI